MTRSLPVLAVFVWMSAADAAADPITALYDVEVVERFSRQDAGPGVIEPFEQHFTLSMTFDPAAGDSLGYGAPTFSAVPLAVPPAPDALTPEPFGSTLHLPLEPGGFVARAQGGVVADGIVDGRLVVYDAIVRLGSSMVMSSPPAVISPETFPIHLGRATEDPTDPFNFSYSSCLGIGPFPPGADSCNDARAMGTRIVSYQGTATLREVEAPAIPEPATLALVGSGVALLFRARRRARDRARVV